MYIYHALINALSAHTIYININVIFYTHVELSRTQSNQNNLHKVLYGKLAYLSEFSRPEGVLDFDCKAQHGSNNNNNMAVIIIITIIIITVIIIIIIP